MYINITNNKIRALTQTLVYCCEIVKRSVATINIKLLRNHSVGKSHDNNVIIIIILAHPY